MQHIQDLGFGIQDPASGIQDLGWPESLRGGRGSKTIHHNSKSTDPWRLYLVVVVVVVVKGGAGGVGVVVVVGGRGVGAVVVAVAVVIGVVVRIIKETNDLEQASTIFIDVYRC